MANQDECPRCGSVHDTVSIMINCYACLGGFRCRICFLCWNAGDCIICEDRVNKRNAAALCPQCCIKYDVDMGNNLIQLCCNECFNNNDLTGKHIERLMRQQYENKTQKMQLQHDTVVKSLLLKIAQLQNQLKQFKE